LPYKEHFIIYAPLKGVAILTNADMAEALWYLQQGYEVSLPDFIEELLISVGIIEQQSLSGNEIPKERKWAPTHVTIFPTADCNLRCVYCYASGGENPQYMKWEIAKAAIDLLFKNAQEQGAKEVTLGFHGGGEPTLAWDILTRSVDYAKRLAERDNLSLQIYIATNGVLNKRKAEWITKHLSGATVSLDGPPDIQNLQRPTPNRKGSYQSVANTLFIFDEANFNYGIRSTITPMNVGRLVEMVEFFHDNFRTKSYHFEPLFFCGRCKTTQWQPPNPNEFVQNFKLAYKRANELGIHLAFSGARLQTLTSTFCGAIDGNFAVTPEGYVTACFEVCSVEDERAGLFMYGKYDHEQKYFLIDEQKLKNLRKYNVNNLPWCANCFAKWHCAGDCLAKVAATNCLMRGSTRCSIIRELTAYQLFMLFENLEGGEEKCPIRVIHHPTTASNQKANP
jgi:uncharacterized protein